MQVHLSSGNYDIVATGETFLFGSHENLIIQIDDADELHIKLIMQFTEDDSGKIDISTKVENDALVIDCLNFKGMGAGTKRPAHIAKIDAKNIYFMFSTNLLGDQENRSRSVKYTVFMEK